MSVGNYISLICSAVQLTFLNYIDAIAWAITPIIRGTSDSWHRHNNQFIPNINVNLTMTKRQVILGRRMQKTATNCLLLFSDIKNKTANFLYTEILFFFLLKNVAS